MAILAFLGALLATAALPQQLSNLVQLEPAVAATNLESKVAPEYPPLARSARVQGAVALQLAITKDGQVSNVKVIRGHALLNDAAVRAVQQWRYKAFAVGGTPAEVTTSVTINFALIEPPKIPSGEAVITGRLLRADGTPQRASRSMSPYLRVIPRPLFPRLPRLPASTVLKCPASCGHHHLPIIQASTASNAWGAELTGSLRGWANKSTTIPVQQQIRPCS